MPMMALQFLGTKMGAWAIVGVLVLALGATWQVQQWRIAARDGQIAALAAQLDQAVGANARYKDALDRVTADLDAATARAVTAQTQLAAARAAVKHSTTAILKEAARAATPLDDAPAPPGLRAALRGLRDAYPQNDP